MIESWFEDWLDIEVIDKKEENEISSQSSNQLSIMTGPLRYLFY